MRDREVKFRAWHTEKKTMLQVGDDFGTTHPLDCVQYFKEGQSVVLLQYAGVKDKNGIEIYEGDIVKQMLGKHYWLNEVKSLGGQFGNNLYLVCFEDNLSVDEDTKHYTFKPQKGSRARSSSLGLTNAEVVGNIYENPELLEGEYE